MFGCPDSLLRGSHYTYGQAHLALRKEDYESARNSLEMALEIRPDYLPAQELLERMDSLIPFQTGFSPIWEEIQERDRAKRIKQQKKLSMPDPTLSEVLSIYTKDTLTSMGRVIIRWGGWSALRKAELLQRIIDELNDPDNLERIVANLNKKEQQALQDVLTNGGRMAWHLFDNRYDNDLEESTYWQYHEPETLMGHLRLRGLLGESTVNKELLVVIPAELRPDLKKILA